MRIVCQKCSAAYAIDDKLVTPKGIRAQCPRCRHLQLVKHEAAVTTPEMPAAGAAPFSLPTGGDLQFDFSAPPAAAPAVTAPSPAAATTDMLDFSDLGGPPPPEPATSPRGLAPLPAPMTRSAAPAPRAMPLPPATMREPAAPLPQSSAPFDFSGDFNFSQSTPGYSSPVKESSGLSLDPPGGVEPAIAGPGAIAAATAVKCKQCGKLLTDPFDQALGICDDCRNVSSSGLNPSDRSGKPVAMAKSGYEALDPPTDPGPEPSQKVKPKARPIQTAYREGDEAQSGGSGRVVLGALALVVVLGAGGAYLFVKRPWAKKPPPMAQKLPAASVRPIDAMVEKWKGQLGDVKGSAADHLQAGEDKLVLDNPRAYADAESEFKKALVLDKSNDRAVAGWALALAFGRGEKIDGETQKVAESMLIAAEQRGGDSRVYAAHAHLLQVRNANLNDIQALADQAKGGTSEKDKALAHLALGQAYLAKNPKAADEHFREAIKADPKLKRAFIYQARLLLSQAEYRAAVQTLEKRLEVDADHADAAELLARTYVEVGELAAAKKALQKALQASRSSPQAKLAMAMLAYQHEGDLGDAAAALDGLLSKRDSLDKTLLAEVLGHRAAVARLQGELSAASAHADAAIALSADHVNAHLQKLFVSLAQGNAAQAREQVPFIKLGDPGLEAAIEGRVLLGEGNGVEAHEKLKKAVEADKHRTDAMLLAGAAAVKGKIEARGWEWALGKGSKADPLDSGPRGAMSRTFVGRFDLLGPARGVFAPLAKDKEDPNPPTAEGLIAWHLGEWADADKEFAKVVAADPTNALGLSYRALAALKKKDTANALKLGSKAVVGDRTLGLAHAALGAAQLASGKADVARKTLTRAVELAPNLLFARVRLAEADAKVKRLPEAKAALTSLLAANPSYGEAKRVLYGIQQ